MEVLSMIILLLTIFGSGYILAIILIFKISLDNDDLNEDQSTNNEKN